MRFVSLGLRLKIGAMLLLYISLMLSLFILIFFPEAVAEEHFFLYSLGTVLALITVDFLGRLLCLSWPKDLSARLNVIGSSSCQIACVAVLIFGAMDRSNYEPSLRAFAFGGFLVIAIASQAASAVLFMGYTRRVCKLLGRDDLAWRPTMVLAAYGLSGASAVTLVIASVLLLIVLWLATCGGLFLGPLIAFALPIRMAASTVVLLLVFVPFRSYGWFLFQLAQTIDKQVRSDRV